MEDLMINFPICGFAVFAVADAFLGIGIWATIRKKVKFRKGFVFGTYHFAVGFSSLLAGLTAGCKFLYSVKLKHLLSWEHGLPLIAFLIIRRYFLSL
ncbi:MAG: hypothetical protein Q9M89_03870 [Persephonella sp.]|nr:hypothetical protein [Persephonella sp.]